MTIKTSPIITIWIAICKIQEIKQSGISNNIIQAKAYAALKVLAILKNTNFTPIDNLFEDLNLSDDENKNSLPPLIEKDGWAKPFSNTNNINSQTSQPQSNESLQKQNIKAIDSITEENNLPSQNNKKNQSSKSTTSKNKTITRSRGKKRDSKNKQRKNNEFDPSSSTDIKSRNSFKKCYHCGFRKQGIWCDCGERRGAYE